MTEQKPRSLDEAKLKPMKKDEINGFLEEYLGTISLAIKREADMAEKELVDSRAKIISLRGEQKSLVVDPSNPVRHDRLLEQEILVAQEYMKSAIRRLKDLTAVKPVALDRELWKRFLTNLLNDGFYRFAMVPTSASVLPALTAWTKFIEIDCSHHHKNLDESSSSIYLLGHYRIEVFINSRDSTPVKIYNLDLLGPLGRPHPHINDLFIPCLGDFMVPVSGFIAKKQYLSVMQILYIFLKSYSLNNPPHLIIRERRPYSNSVIEFWPQKQIVSAGDKDSERKEKQ